MEQKASDVCSTQFLQYLATFKMSRDWGNAKDFDPVHITGEWVHPPHPMLGYLLDNAAMDFGEQMSSSSQKKRTVIVPRFCNTRRVSGLASIIDGDSYF